MKGAASDWKIVRLGEVISLRREFIHIDDIQKYKRCRVQLHAKGIVLRDEVEGITIKTKKQQVCRDGELLVAEIDAKVGGFGIVPLELNGAIVSSHYFLYTINPEKVDNAFIDYFVRTPFFRGQVQAQGSTNYAAIKADQVLDYQIPLPSLSEQRRIVTKIDRLATKIEKAKGLRKKSGLVTKNFLDAALVQIFKDQLDETWVDGCLGDFVIDDCYGTSEKTHDEHIGVPILRMGNIQNGALDVKDLKYLQISKKDTQKLILRPGDTLVNRTNSAELVGKCAVFNLEGEWGFASYIIRLRLDTKKANPYLVAKYINSSLGREYMFREKKQMTGQANVNAKKLKGLPIKLPPIRQQKRIVEHLDSLQSKVDGLKILQSKTAAELDALLPSILDKAFKGEL